MSHKNDKWLSVMKRVNSIFEDMETAEVLKRGNAFGTGMDVQAHVAAECCNIIREECSSLSIDDTIAIAYHAAIASEAMLKLHESERHGRWGPRVSPEAMSLMGFSEVSNE